MEKKYSLIEYEKLPVFLKRYTIESKLDIAQRYARASMTANSVDEKLRHCLPFELEVFVNLSLCSYEYQYKVMDDATFIRVINSIKNYNDPEMLESMKSGDLSSFFVATAAMQFRFQNDYQFVCFRYWYLYRYVDDEVSMPDVFINEFGVPGELFIYFAVIFHTIVSDPANDKYLSSFMYLFAPVVSKIVLTREEYARRQNEKRAQNLTGMYYGFKYISAYPLIEINSQIFTPLPFNIVPAVTESLLTRITNPNELLRGKLGKILEKYVYELMDGSSLFDEVHREISYKVHKNRHDSSDIMCRKDSYAVFVECKAMTPGLGLRTGNKERINQAASRLGGYVKQLYGRMNEYGHHYNPFSVGEIVKKDRFGILLVQYDTFVQRKLIYEAAFLLLKISADSSEAAYIKSNFLIMELYELERLTLLGEDFFGCLVDRRDNIKSHDDFSTIILNSDIKKTHADIAHLLYRSFQDGIIQQTEKMKGCSQT